MGIAKDPRGGLVPRSLWKGHLRLSLVTIPIRVFSATNAAAEVSFNQLHRECQTRIQYKKWCPACDREVTNDKIVKGFEFEKGRYVALEDEDIQNVRPESTRVVNLGQVTDRDQIEPMLYDTPYYLAPDGKVAAESFAVLRDALEGKAAVGTVAFHGRERLVAIEPKDNGLVMYTLRRTAELRKMSTITELDDVPKKAKAEEVQLAKRVMGGFEQTIDFAKCRDSYEDALRKMIDKKIAGKEIVETEEPDEAPRVVNLMDALRKSLDQVSGAKKKPARAKTAAKKKPTRVAQFKPKKRAS
jgi:DNA end-binding protein Ku